MYRMAFAIFWRLNSPNVTSKHSQDLKDPWPESITLPGHVTWLQRPLDTCKLQNSRIAMPPSGRGQCVNCIHLQGPGWGWPHWKFHKESGNTSLCPATLSGLHRPEKSGLTSELIDKRHLQGEMPCKWISICLTIEESGLTAWHSLRMILHFPAPLYKYCMPSSAFRVYISIWEVETSNNVHSKSAPLKPKHFLHPLGAPSPPFAL